MNILAFESSCDETAAAVLDGEEIVPAGGGRMRKCERQLLGLRPGVVGFDWVSHCQL